MKVSYWRERGREVDFIISRGRHEHITDKGKVVGFVVQHAYSDLSIL
ncbi:MAG: hypothetical protein HZA08_09680 [Nitrospirae bacterium]|nr:hypothetical protein [Nitrospirota bacterium]